MNQLDQAKNLPTSKSGKPWIFVLVLLALVPYLSSLSDPFFWDTIQFAGKHGLFYYEHRWQLLPREIDSGHLPFLGFYLAQCWKLFGMSLAVSHLAMLPFLLTYMLAAKRLSEVISSQNSIWLWVLFLTEPCWLAQSTLVSPDVVLMAGFALTTLGFSETNRTALFFGGLLLALSGNRGAALVCAVILAMTLWNASKRKEIPYLLPGLGLFALYQIYHWIHSDWIGFHEDMEWAPSFERVGLLGMIKNLGLVAWRLVDTGRIGLCLVIVYFVLRSHKQLDFLKHPRVILFLSSMLILLGLTLPYQYLTGHRYYMPLYFLLIALLPIFIKSLVAARQEFIFIIIGIGFLLGHLLVYPRGIAMGWDSTLAYQPYQQLRKEVISYLRSNEIDINSTGSAFPNISGFRATDLLPESEEKFKNYEIGNDEYILYSNVMNDMSDELPKIQELYNVEQQWHSSRIECILFKKKP